MKIECDPVKRMMTLEARGLDFERANELFATRHTTVMDNRREYGEARYATMGWRTVG